MGLKIWMYDAGSEDRLYMGHSHGLPTGAPQKIQSVYCKEQFIQYDLSIHEQQEVLCMGP